MRQSECNTLPELIEKRYSGKYSIVMSLLIVVSCTALLGAQVTGATIILQTFSNWSTLTCCVILLAVFVVFTCIGGMKAVAWDRYDLLLRNHHWYLADRNPVPVKGWRIYSYERRYCSSESGICKRIQC